MSECFRCGKPACGEIKIGEGVTEYLCKDHLQQEEDIRFADGTTEKGDY